MCSWKVIALNANPTPCPYFQLVFLYGAVFFLYSFYLYYITSGFFLMFSIPALALSHCHHRYSIVQNKHEPCCTQACHVYGERGVGGQAGVTWRLPSMSPGRLLLYLARTAARPLRARMQLPCTTGLSLGGGGEGERWRRGGEVEGVWRWK